MKHEVHFWYMRDNHTFLRLTGDTLREIADKARELPNDPQYRHGMLCPPIYIRDGVETRPIIDLLKYPNKFTVHSQGPCSPEWKAAVEGWYNDVSELPEVKEFFMSDTINKTGNWIIRVSIAMPSGEEITVAKAVAPDQVKQFRGDLIGHETIALAEGILDELKDD